MSQSMPIDEVIIPLRRYARAVTGSTETADNLLADCIAQALQMVKSGQDLQRAMWFKLLDGVLSVWVTSQNRFAQADSARRAFLLYAMEELSMEEVGFVLETEAENVSGLIAKAEENLAATLSTTVMIIEDEPMIAALLAHTVKQLHHEHVGTAATADQAIEMARELKPGLILSDVQLAQDSSGIVAVSEIQAFLPNTPVIFITAFPESFLQGQQGEPEYLIPKPFQPQYVQAVISQALLVSNAN